MMLWWLERVSWVLLRSFSMKEGLRVAVLERGNVGGGATAAAMGHLVAMDDSPAQLALTKLSLQLWKELEDQLPASAEYRQPGTLWIASDDEEMTEVRRKYEDLPIGRDMACEVLDARVAWQRRSQSFGGRSPALCACLGDGVILSAGRGCSFFCGRWRREVRSVTELDP